MGRLCVLRYTVGLIGTSVRYTRSNVEDAHAISAYVVE
jgi:hypothetical protein